jgi:hypothetical protein
MGTLVVGTDGSDHSRAALLEAIDLGRRSYELLAPRPAPA